MRQETVRLMAARLAGETTWREPLSGGTAPSRITVSDLAAATAAIRAEDAEDQAVRRWVFWAIWAAPAEMHWFYDLALRWVVSEAHAIEYTHAVKLAKCAVDAAVSPAKCRQCGGAGVLRSVLGAVRECGRCEGLGLQSSTRQAMRALKVSYGRYMREYKRLHDLVVRRLVAAESEATYQVARAVG